MKHTIWFKGNPQPFEFPSHIRGIGPPTSVFSSCHSPFPSVKETDSFFETERAMVNKRVVRVMRRNR